MSLKENLRIIWAITAKDCIDAVKNKIVQGVLIGVGFVMLSSQALSFLVKLKDEPTAYFWDQGKSITIREIVRSHEINLRPEDNFDDLNGSVSQSVEPVLGIKIPADFDLKLEEGSVHLNAYMAHWIKPDVIQEVVKYYEEYLTRLADAEILINVSDARLYPPDEGQGYPMMIALGMVVGVMTVGLILTPYLIVDEKETHTLDAILISPARISHLLFGKSLVGLFYGLIASILIILFSWYWIVHLEILILAIFLGSLCAVSIGLLIGAIVDNPTSVNMIIGLLIAGLLMPMYLWTSIAPRFSPFLLSLFNMIPSIAMYKIVRQSFTEFTNWNIVWINLVILITWIVIFLGIVSWLIHRLDR